VFRRTSRTLKLVSPFIHTDLEGCTSLHVPIKVYLAIIHVLLSDYISIAVSIPSAGLLHWDPELSCTGQQISQELTPPTSSPHHIELTYTQRSGDLMKRMTQLSKYSLTQSDIYTWMMVQ
jgi:hypothetical protein